MSKDDWMNRKWRPAMGWMYMVVCITDFILFPIAWSIFQAYIGKSVEPWEPLTLQGAGLFHVAMGAVLGVAAWSRGQEKISGANVNSYVDDPRQYRNVDDKWESNRYRPNIRRKPAQEEYPEL